MPTCWLAPQPALLSMFSCTLWMSSRQEPRPCPTLASRCGNCMVYAQIQLSYVQQELLLCKMADTVMEAD